MFTIKHIHLSGEEHLHSGRFPRFVPKEILSSSTGDDQSYLAFDLPDGTSHLLYGGTVFVMNETGKTVARYDLGASPVPIIGDGLNDSRPKGLMTASELASYHGVK